MQDMRDLYKAYSAVHDTSINEELSQGRDQISEMNLGQMLESDLVEVCEEIVEGLFQYGLGLEEACSVVKSVLEESKGVSSSLRDSKITQIVEAFETVIGTVTDKAERNCEEEFLKYRQNKPLTEKWNNRVSHEVGNQKLHAALIHEDRENIKRGLIEMISDLIEARKPGEAPQAYADRMKKKYAGGKSKTYDPMKDKNFDHDKAERTRGSMEEGDSSLRQGWGDAYAAIYEKKLDPVGKEDGDIDNDGDKDSSDEFLAKRRKAIAKNMKKESYEKAIKANQKELDKLEKGKEPATAKRYREMKKEEIETEGFIPINKEKQTKIDRQIGRAADKESIEQGKSKKYGRDEKKIEKQYQRQQAMRFGKKMKKEGVEFSEAELARIEEIVNSWEG